MKSIYRIGAIAGIVRKLQDLPGQELFQYLDNDGEVHDVTSQDVNEYLHEITGEYFTAKDFRTWAGTLLAAMALNAQEDSAQRKRPGQISKMRLVPSRKYLEILQPFAGNAMSTLPFLKPIWMVS